MSAKQEATARLREIVANAEAVIAKAKAAEEAMARWDEEEQDGTRD